MDKQLKNVPVQADRNRVLTAEDVRDGVSLSRNPATSPVTEECHFTAEDVRNGVTFS